MFSQLHMLAEPVLLALFFALETASAAGLEQGMDRGIEPGLAEGHDHAREEGLEDRLKVGLVNLVRQGLLTSEVVSQQLCMTVSEFDSLL